MSASLVGSEMCIRDRCATSPGRTPASGYRRICVWTSILLGACAPGGPPAAEFACAAGALFSSAQQTIAL
eukprot:282360-Alexandrium_andersonii.AAC.1